MSRVEENRIIGWEGRAGLLERIEVDDFEK